MKALNDALAADGFPAQFKILTEIPIKEYPALLKAIGQKREDLKREQAAYGSQDHPDRESLEEEIRTKALCVDAAEMLAHQTKKKLPSGFIPSPSLLKNDEIVAFLTTRSPAWLPDLFRTQRKFCQHEDVVYRYLQAGAIPPPPDGDPYYVNIFEFVRHESNGNMAKAKQFLTDNPDLVTRDLPIKIRGITGPHHRQHFRWRFFYDLRSSEDFSIYKAVSDLCHADVFEISPLLIAFIEMLAELPGESDARHIIRLFEELSPTPADYLEVQGSLFSLLMARHKSCVGAAIDIIATIAGLPGFDARGFINHVGAVFLHPSNPLQLATLKLIKEIASHHPEVTAMIPAGISSALLNTNLKVQTAVLAALKILPKSEAGRISEAIAPFADRVLPTLQAGFSPWLMATAASEEPPVIMENTQETDARLQPIQSPQDLAFIANGLLNRDLDVMQFELFLDALARFAAADRAALAEAFAPLHIRADKVMSGKSKTGPRHSGLSLFASRLIVALCPNADEGDRSMNSFQPLPDISVWPVGEQEEWDEQVLGFLYHRLGELLQAIRGGRSMQLMGIPEFDLGFISPATLVKRVRMLATSGLPALHFDLIQAIARCQLSGIDESIELPETDDEPSRVISFLLSGKIRGEIQTPAWWLTAARSREPFGDVTRHPHFSKYHLPDEPDWTEPVRYRSLSEYGIEWHDSFGPILTRRYPGYAPNHLYSLQHTAVDSATDVRWRYSCTPGFLDAAVACDMQHSYPDSSMGLTKSDAPAAVMAEFAIRRLPLRRAMCVHLLVALNSPDTATRESATELIVQASRDGRLAKATVEMGGVFSEILRGGPVADPPVFQINRMLPCLRQLAMNGPVLRLELRDILMDGLALPPATVPKGFPSLLELLLELVSAHPPGSALDLNSAWKGLLDGKSKTLAARISKIVAMG